MEKDTIELIEKWCRFCEGTEKTDYSDFYTLFHGKLTDEAIRTILQYFPKKDELFERVKYVKERQFDRENNLTQDDIIALIEQDRTEKVNILDDIGETETANQVRSLPIKQLTEKKDFNKHLMDFNSQLDVTSLIGDFLRSERVSREIKYYGLFEAFYGLTTWFGIQWFLGAPLVNYDIDFRSDVTLWANKVQYIHKKDAIYFSV